MLADVLECFHDDAKGLFVPKFRPLPYYLGANFALR